MTSSETVSDTTVILVNLGTPEAPTAPAVARFLREFLLDPRVVSIPRLLWQPLLQWVILPRRSPVVAEKYAQVWLSGEDGGSPLTAYTRRLARGVQARLPGLKVLDAMRYGAPSLQAALQAERAAGTRRVLVLPLYPQYSTTTTLSVEDAVATVAGLPVRTVRDYHVDPQWVAAVADSVRTHRAAHSAGEHLVFSFHGLPQRLVDRGDPYQQQCEAGARAIAAALGLAGDAWTLSYQSRFGKEKWLGPATDTTLKALTERGVRSIDVIAPGFSVDCLETLEEVAIGLAEQVAHAGGTLRYIPCLNDSPAHAEVIAGIVRRELAAWA
ncbi:ferrochelatase [Aerolutibacter ruishenii]|uniref:Ferrochelatase n=1 Tax=Aerolutibacter ruishenii TaxID=686800 RepID=A0A562M195_9GAMM|nr:ferrochelatase [Lysobacter ruishenii]TWI13371.1 ferrochelatase [Lysobacter ruishenii]